MKYILLISMLLFSCGKPKTINGKIYPCYGFFDKIDNKKPNIQYGFVVKNLIPSVIFAETIMVPILILGYQSHCPIDTKNNKENK